MTKKGQEKEEEEEYEPSSGLQRHKGSKADLRGHFA
jgi:hypothetical protein